MKIEQILKYIGTALLLEALFLFISAAVSAHFDFDQSFCPLLTSGILIGILGFFPRIFVRKGEKLTTREGMFIVVGSWLFCCLFGTLPYFMYGLSWTDAWFETVSGFTTTGASILTDIEALPKGLLFWRLSTAWIGGIGIVALFSLVIPSISGNGNVLTGIEVSTFAKGSTSTRQKSLVDSMILTYIIITIVGILALRLSGMNWFDAATHAMSACSTCGFGTKNNSIAAFNSPLIECVLIVLMLVSCLKFSLLSGTMRKGGFKRLLGSEITKAFLRIITFGTIALTLGLFFGNGGHKFMSCLRQAAFQVASIFTTTGFATVDTNAWSPLCRNIIIIGSLVCGCSGSTSGGIKVDRYVTIYKSLWNKILALETPNAVHAIEVDKRKVGEKEEAEVYSYLVMYLGILCAGAILYSMLGIDAQTAWTASIACMGNVGPGFGEVGSMGNYAALPDAAKWIGSIQMLTGRLEINPILYVLFAFRAK